MKMSPSWEMFGFLKPTVSCYIFFQLKKLMLSLQTANYGSYFMIKSLWTYSQSHQRPSKGCVSHSGSPILTLSWAFWRNRISDSSYVKLLFPYLSLRSGVMGSLRFGIYTTSGSGPTAIYGQCDNPPKFHIHVFCRFCRPSSPYPTRQANWGRGTTKRREVLPNDALLKCFKIRT